MSNLKMPRISIVPGVEKGTVDVALTKPSQINAGNPSAFPLAEDRFKGLNYQTASKSELNKELGEYYEIMSRVMSGTAGSSDLGKLQSLTTKIREYVLTDDDYNLVIGSLQNIQSYILKFMYTDIGNKSKAIDNEMNKIIGDVNRFMTELETVYSKSPSDYPIPDQSVLKQKLEGQVQDTIDYSNASNGIIVSTKKPANPVGKGFIWFNTGDRV